MTTLTLNCLLLGDHPYKNFEVQVPKNMTISNLKRTLQSDANLSDAFEDVPPKDIEVWKVEISTTKKGCNFVTYQHLAPISKKDLGEFYYAKGILKLRNIFQASLLIMRSILLSKAHLVSNTTMFLATINEQNLYVSLNFAIQI